MDIKHGDGLSFGMSWDMSFLGFAAGRKPSARRREAAMRALVRANAASGDPAMAFGPSCGRTGEWNRPVTQIGSGLAAGRWRLHFAMTPAFERLNFADARLKPRTKASAANTQPLDQ
jgi:hypothetical protein